ncbi:hypothetical protein P9112_003863 [Eukaryota sp. TZLM1-RC]
MSDEDYKLYEAQLHDGSNSDSDDIVVHHLSAADAKLKAITHDSHNDSNSYDSEDWVTDSAEDSELDDISPDTPTFHSSRLLSNLNRYFSTAHMSTKCHRCGGFGHLIAECPYTPASGCFTCGRSGHMARNCPFKPETSTLFNKLFCYKCGQSHPPNLCHFDLDPSCGVCYGNHRSWHCSQGKELARKLVCICCGGRGHVLRECQSNIGQTTNSLAWNMKTFRKRADDHYSQRSHHQSNHRPNYQSFDRSRDRSRDNGRFRPREYSDKNYNTRLRSRGEGQSKRIRFG